ncbi:MAG: glycoside hydrolase family 13 protein [Chloroflexota bacterium]
MTGRSERAPASVAWWRHAVVYQVYIRSFADGDGDGIGDIPGLRHRLPYLRDLGVDAIWITPWYVSPMADGGYDVADYRAVDPIFGTLDDAAGLIADAHALGLRVLIDIVPNHTSDQHAWFREALAGPRGSAARARYHFVDGRGADGDEPPNNWPSVFGGPAWARVTEPDGAPGQWYLHIFAPEQPDLNWDNPEVRAEFESILGFWLDRDVDGFRIDVAHAMIKAPGLPDLRPEDITGQPLAPGGHPHWDQARVHEIHRSWRRIVDRYPGERILIGEIGLDDPNRLAAYLRPDELQTAFNFAYMGTPWDAEALRTVIDSTLDAHRGVAAPPTWVLANHDATRQVTRLGRPFTGFRNRELDDILRSDLALGTTRARAAILMMLALPGCAYLYQGEELGLREVEDLPESALQDPIWERSGHAIRGRDGCRVPLPWEGEAPPFGFGPEGSVAWLPQPAAWRTMTAEAQSRDDDSMLALYRAALRIRRGSAGFRDDRCAWLASPAGTLLFGRGDGILCAVNVSADALPLPPGLEWLIGSVARTTFLPPNAAAWYRAPSPRHRSD